MTKSIEANIKPELLVWGRTTRGWSVTVAAKQLGVTTDRLRSLETGERRPTVAFLRKAAEQYKRPLAVFFLSCPPSPPTDLPEYRTLFGDGPGGSPELLLAIRTAREQRRIAMEMYELLGDAPPRFDLKVALSDRVVQAAAAIRTSLGVSEEAQWSAGRKSQHSGLAFWRALIEAVGVLVFQASDLSPDDARGFSIAVDVLPVVVVSSKDAPRARAFSLLHELVHLALGRSGICDDMGSTKRSSDPREEIESFCNAVAAETFVPTHLLLAERVVASHAAGVDWLDSQLAALSRRWGASEEVIARRLLAVGKMTDAEFRRRQADYRNRARRTRTGHRPFTSCACRNSAARSFGSSSTRTTASGSPEAGPPSTSE